MTPNPKRVARRFLGFAEYPAEYASRPLRSRRDYGEEGKPPKSDSVSHIPGDAEEELEENLKERPERMLHMEQE